LRDPDPPRIVNVTGAGTWSEREVARLVASLAGRPLAVEAVPPAHRAAALQAAGLGRSYAEALAQMHAAFEAGAAAFAPADLEVAGYDSFEDVLRSALAWGRAMPLSSQAPRPRTAAAPARPGAPRRCSIWGRTAWPADRPRGSRSRARP